MKRNKLNFVLALLAGAMLFSCTSEERYTASGIDKNEFLKVVEGDQNCLYTMTNANGMEVAITNYGGRIVSIWVPDKNGEFGDVVLGFGSIDDYLNNASDFGAFIGRYGNRIAQGLFTLDDVEYDLPKNNYGHCLHGGDKGFQYRMCEITQTEPNSVTLKYTAEDGEMGFPGNLECEVVYTVTDDNELKIEYTATTDKPTVVNLTNHSYFNLTGDPTKPITDHIICINADEITPVDETYMTYSVIEDVTDTDMDFREPTAIGERIDNFEECVQLKNGNGYDHNYVLNTKGDITEPAVVVIEPESGRTLVVYTDQPGVQFYTGNFLDGTLVGKHGIVYEQRTGFCLETQHYPNSPNEPTFPSTVLRPGETYKNVCIYKFGVVKTEDEVAVEVDEVEEVEA